jgi:hypothetical protein
MIGLGIGILWFALGVILVAVCIMVAFWGLARAGVPVPPPIPAVVWAVFAILCLIYLLVLIEGGGLSHPGVFR